MKVFISSPRVGEAGSAADELILRLRATGAEVTHSPPDQGSVAAGDPRLAAWESWYVGRCAAVVSGADAFIAVVDDGCTCSTWMAVEATAAADAASARKAPRLGWYEDTPRGGATYLPAWWATALGVRLPDELPAAVAAILARAGAGTSPEAAT